MSMKVIFVSVSMVLLGVIAPARAATPQRLAIGQFRGPQAGRIQGAVESGLMARYYVVPDFSVDRAAKHHGVRLSSDDEFAVVGRALEVAGFVSAQVLNKKTSWQVRLQVRRGDTGTPAGSFVLANRRLDRLEDQVAKQAPARVQRLLAQAARRAKLEAAGATAAAAAAESGGAEADVSDTAPEASPDDPAAPPLLEMSVDGRVFTRSFSYVQNLSALPDYRLARSYSAALDATFYPAALAGQLPPVGVTGALEYAPDVKSRAAGSGESEATSVHAYRVGLKYRLGWDTASLTPQVAYGVQTFVTGDPSLAAPDVRYQFVHMGLDGRWSPGTRLSFFGSAAFLYGLSVGRMADPERFPRVTANGAAFEGGAAFAVARAVELRLTVGLRRFGLAMHSRPGDALVAGGAVDQVAWMGLGVAYRPGVSP
jgi:hypothetical protein